METGRGFKYIMGEFILPVNKEADSMALTEKVVKYADECASGSLLDYLKIREPKTFSEMIECKFQELYRDGKYDDYNKELREWGKKYAALAKRLKTPIKQDQIKRIHTMKSKLQMLDVDYRNLLIETTRQSSSKDLNWCQGELVIMALQKSSENTAGESK
jgi:hypothetical protein